MQGVFKSFVSEKEIEEVKQKRQDEWEKVRRPDQPLQRPEEAVDHRTLYERLKEQKDMKQDEFLEQLKFKNMIYKGLDDEEASFLTFVAQRQADQETEMIKREIEEVHSFRDAVSKLQDEQELTSLQQTSSSSDKGDPLTSSSSGSGGFGSGANKPKVKSKQLALIAGSIKTKRKRSQSSEGDKDTGTSSKSEEATVLVTPEKKQKLDPDTVAEDVSKPAEQQPSTAEVTNKSRKPSTSHALSGLMAYSSSSEDNDDDDS